MKKQYFSVVFLVILFSISPGAAASSSLITPPVGSSSCLAAKLPSNPDDSLEIRWWNPASNAFATLEGQAWPGETADFYDRLPARAENTVREAVWNLSQDATGLLIRFRTDAPEIHVRYAVEDATAMPHMPATGVSGVDLYALKKDGEWTWTGGKYAFNDTITYHFQSLQPDSTREYHLYLPLYNKVKWLEIGVPGSAQMQPLPARTEQAVVIYGTSIAQGGCASRPGLSWTAILGRMLNRPVINLAFSGNGRLEAAISDLLVELDPALFIVDCLPNMQGFPDDTIKTRLINTITTLRKNKPSTPILIAEHAGATINSLNTIRENGYKRVNQLASTALHEMETSGDLQRIHLLTAGEIGLSIESTVDGVHPNDIGMMEYARAYDSAIRDVLTPAGKQ